MNQTMTEPEAPPSTPAPEAVEPARSLKEEFLRFTERFGHLMSRVLLTVLYVTLVAPGGIVMSLFGDALRIRKYRGTSWDDWQSTNETPEQARRQD